MVWPYPRTIRRFLSFPFGMFYGLNLYDLLLNVALVTLSFCRVFNFYLILSDLTIILISNIIVT